VLSEPVPKQLYRQIEQLANMLTSNGCTIDGDDLRCEAVTGCDLPEKSASASKYDGGEDMGETPATPIVPTRAHDDDGYHRDAGANQERAREHRAARRDCSGPPMSEQRPHPPKLSGRGVTVEPASRALGYPPTPMFIEHSPARWTLPVTPTTACHTPALRFSLSARRPEMVMT